MLSELQERRAKIFGNVEDESQFITDDRANQGNGRSASLDGAKDARAIIGGVSQV